jgi:MoxR-like ATPase
VTDQTSLGLRDALTNIRREVAKAVVGQDSVVTGLVIALLCRGHVLLEGVPGVAKTLLVRSLAASLHVETKRLQFTPDLMPGDVTGSLVYDARTAEFSFSPGPVFTNLLLADEINRTPPKTQAALLQAMQERAVTAAGDTYPLPAPFFVLATQNPIEQEGTYPLPEAQLDRFMFELRIDYPSREEEEAVALRTTGEGLPEVRPVVAAESLLELQQLVRRVPAAPALVAYAVRLARSTRPAEDDAPEVTRQYVSWGAGPRASQYLVLGAKARAAIRGEPVPSYEDVRAVAQPVLAHRIVPSFEAEADRVSSHDVIEELLRESRAWT